MNSRRVMAALVVAAALTAAAPPARSTSLMIPDNIPEAAWESARLKALFGAWEGTATYRGVGHVSTYGDYWQFLMTPGGDAILVVWYREGRLNMFGVLTPVENERRRYSNRYRLLLPGYQRLEYSARDRTIEVTRPPEHTDDAPVLVWTERSEGYTTDVELKLAGDRLTVTKKNTFRGGDTSQETTEMRRTDRRLWVVPPGEFDPPQ